MYFFLLISQKYGNRKKVLHEVWVAIGLVRSIIMKVC